MTSTESTPEVIPLFDENSENSPKKVLLRMGHYNWKSYLNVPPKSFHTKTGPIPEVVDLLDSSYEKDDLESDLDDLEKNNEEMRVRPGAQARPLDQGKEPTCTAHAVANAVCDYLMAMGIDVDQKAFIGGLMQYLKDTKGKDPMELSGLVVKNMHDENSGSYGDVRFYVTEGMLIT